MTDADSDVERTVVKTYVPRYQKERWREHAEDLDMSQSEFLRMMVQAGRRGFDFEDSNPESSNGEEGGPSGSDPRGDGLEDLVLGVLSGEGYRSWDELVAALTEDLEDRLEEALDSLQAANRVQHSGRNGGYTLTGAGDE